MPEDLQLDVRGVSADARYLQQPQRLSKSSPRRKRLVNVCLTIASPVAVLALWQLAGSLNWIDVRFFPPPSAIVGGARSLLDSGVLLSDLAISGERIGIGFLMGAAAGLLIGVVMGVSSLIRAVLQPLIGALYPIPKIAILPLLLLIFGVGELSKYLVVAIGVFYLVLINTLAGVLNIDPVYLKVAKNFGAGRLRTVTTVAVPGALPVIFAGLKLAWGSALVLIVSAEFVGANNGIGYLMWHSWQIFAVPEMYVSLIVISLAGFISFVALDALERILIPWRAGD